MRKLFTSESVTEGHPDKVADQISDAVLDNVLAQDPQGRVACETFVTTGLVMVGGEISTNCYVDIPSLTRQTLREIGYVNADFGFDAETCAVITSVDEQSGDIAMGVNQGWEAKQGQKDEALQLGAGDQGMMFGYACNDTDELMPLPISMAHCLTRRLAEARKSGELPWLRPDGKSQVTVEYQDNGSPLRISTVVLSAQHSDKIDIAEVREELKKQVILPTLPADMLDAETQYFINPTGRFVIGGPHGDTGLTGRKIIVDTYGGMARHGGGAFSGKDPTKVDRSASYYARYIAKNLVAARLADKCEVQLAYAIGVAQPVSVRVETFGTSCLDEKELVRLVYEYFDMRPAAIIRQFDLRRPIYRQTASYGHFGRPELNLPWEKTDKAAILKQHC